MLKIKLNHGLKLLYVGSILLFLSCKAQLTQSQIQQNLTELNNNIIGIWVNEEDSNWKIEFTTNGNCNWYYTNEDTDVFEYTILTSSPQCGQEVKTGGLEDFYLKLINQNDNSDEYCYEVLGVNNESLSISTIGIGVKNHYFLRE